MADGWRETQLGKIVELKRGYDLPKSERRPGSVPLVSSSGVTDYHAGSKVAGPGVVTGRYGTLGQVFFIREDFWPLNTTLYVRDFKGNDPRFVSYFLKTIDFLSYSDKAAVPGVNRNHLHEAVVRCPEDIREQRAIARILEGLDDKMELNRRMNETLERVTRALFKSWFVDFAPVRANMEGREAGLSREVADLFPKRMTNSEMGLVPEGWKVVALPEAVDVNPRRPLPRGQSAPYVDMASMPTLGHKPEKVINRTAGSGTRFTNGDTLMARITPCLENGKTAYVDFLRDGEIGWGSTEYIVLRPKPPLPHEFAYCLARSNGFRDFAVQNMTGTSGRQRVAAKSLEQLLLAIPPVSVANIFGQAVRTFLSRGSSAVDESRRLAALRDSLLPKLISGALRIEHAEAIASRRQ